MRTSAIVGPVTVVWILQACDSEAARGEHQAKTETKEAREGTGDGPERKGAGPVPESWVRERVQRARARLQGSPGGELLWKAIEAHGGLATWLQHGTIAFEFDYRPLGKPEKRMHTLNKVDIWNSRAYQKELGEDGDAEFGWDGSRGWITPGPNAFPAPARFWATSPYYFVGIPWVLADPGTKHEKLDDATLEGDTYHLVRVTYESGTGDSPDDYYIVYIDPESHHIAAIRYIVSYPGMFPEGEHSPEKLMKYLEYEQVQGLRIAHRYVAFPYDTETAEHGERVTEVDIADVQFGRKWPDTLFAPPDGAHVVDDIDEVEP